MFSVALLVFLLYNAVWVMLMKNIQKDLLAAFEASELTYDELAKRTNLPKSALYRYLNGDTEKIPIDRFQAICAELHADASSILGWNNDKKLSMDLQLFAGDVPTTSEARILAHGVDRLPEEERKKALAVVQAMFTQYADYFQNGELINDSES